MDIWLYDIATGELIGPSQADPDPEVQNNFIIPAFCTTEPPPAAIAGKARVWHDSAWQQIEDHRGETWWSDHNTEVEINDLGPANGLFKDRPAPPPLTLSELLAYAATKRNLVEVGGVTSATFGPLLTDRETRAMIGDIIQSIDLGIVNEPVNFKSPSGFVRLSRPQFVTFAKEMAAHVQASFNVEETVINAIKSGAITTASEIDEIFNTDARL